MPLARQNCRSEIVGAQKRARFPECMLSYSSKTLSGTVQENRLNEGSIGLVSAKGVGTRFNGLPSQPVALLANYLRSHGGTLLMALGCAWVNQVFLMVDPLIFRRVLDQYAVAPGGRT